MLRDPEIQIVLGAIALLTGLGWCAMLLVSPEGQMFICGGSGIAPLIPPWNAGHAVALLGMWTAMTCMMMLPGAAAEIAKVSWAERERGGILLASLWFSAGYLGVMAMGGAGGAIAKWIVESADTASKASEAGPLPTLVLLAIAGAFTLSPFGRHVPDEPVDQYTGGNKQPALLRGFRHGVSCLPSCVAMICIQLVVGAMNVTWMMLAAVWMVASVPRRATTTGCVARRTSRPVLERWRA